MLKKAKLWMASFFNKEEKETEAAEVTETKKVTEAKKAIATYHAGKRLEERHGKVLTEKMASSCISDIKSGKAEFLKDTRDNTQAWIVTYEKKKYRVIYNYETEDLVTIYRNIKDKRIKPSRRKKNKIEKRLNIYDASYKKEKTHFKKPYKRNKKVKYNEII